MFDDRLLRVGLKIKGKMMYFEGLSMFVMGNKYASNVINDATIKITNLTKEQRNFILTETTPYNLHKNYAKHTITVEAGRKSYGYTLIYVGSMFRSSIAQPPDITLTIKCLTGFNNASAMSQISMGKVANLKQIAQRIAKENGVKLVFEATNKNISNFQYIGSILHQIDKLENLGKISAYIDNDKLIVKDLDKPLKGKISIISEKTGMVGIPTTDGMGIQVKTLFNPDIKAGGLIELKSELYPAANGKYIAYKVEFELASRETPFYQIIDGKRQNI